MKQIEYELQEKKLIPNRQMSVIWGTIKVDFLDRVIAFAEARYPIFLFRWEQRGQVLYGIGKGLDGNEEDIYRVLRIDYDPESINPDIGINWSTSLRGSL